MRERERERERTGSEGEREEREREREGLNKERRLEIYAAKISSPVVFGGCFLLPKTLTPLLLLITWILASVSCLLFVSREKVLFLTPSPDKMAFCSMFCCGKGSDGKEQGKKEVTWRIFSLKELHAATNNFNYDNKLGEGGFGSVYWGQLWDGSQIAIKRLKVWSNKADMEFAVEVEILARVRHKNLLSLRGYCAEGQERLIVYDYMPNLSLLSHLHGQHSAECHLDWNRRMNIAIGSAEGIVYLHHHATPHIIHRDIKASNVLLDSEFQAQVADFGFAKLIPDGATHVTTRVKGTLGYLAPEYAMFGKASESCDVYSFGILLLELVSGKRPIEKMSSTMKRTITDWALPLACEKKFNDLADPKLNGKFVEEELKRVVLVALVSADSKPEKRPTMLEVLELLKGNSKEKLADLENNDLFKDPQTGGYTDGGTGPEASPDIISEENDTNEELKEIKPDPGNPHPHGS